MLPAGNQTSQDVVFSSDDISPYISIKQGGFLMIPMRGAVKQYTSQSQGFTVIFDVDIDNNMTGSASIYPSFGYYNPKTFGKKGFNQKFLQGGKIGTNTYRVSAYCTPIDDDDLEGYDELYSSITVANSGDVKIRNAYIVGGLYSVNEPISEGNYATDFVKVVDSSTSIASYDDLGIFVPSKTSIVSDYYQSFKSSLLTEVDLGNGKKMLKYPIRI